MNGQISNEESGIRLISRLRMPYLIKHFNARYVWAVFVFINSFITISYLSILAFFTHFPLIFPSLGPTAILFFLTPNSIAARPRNAILGHAIGIICGFLALLVTGLATHPSVLNEGVTLPRVIAASMALAFTGAVMVIARTPHPPAGATTLIIALGIITQPFHLVIIEFAVVLLVMQAIIINQLSAAETHEAKFIN